MVWKEEVDWIDLYLFKDYIHFMQDSKIFTRLRKGRVLTSAQFGCLRGIPTLNITNGCIFQCAYCYARGYSQAPKKGEVDLYVNLPASLETELSRRKTTPSWVILNTSSDCFQTHPDILDITYDVTRVLIEHHVGISFLTKGIIPQRFIDLFAQSAGMVFAQIGLVCLSDQYWRGYESGTPSPEKRLENIERLKSIGILPQVRIDPIIPFVTDTESEMDHLFRRLKELEIEKATLSYLHLRPAIHRQLMRELPPLHGRLIESCFRTREWEEIGSSTTSKLLPASIRERGYQRMRNIAQGVGITADICQCKNPDLKGDLCGSGRVMAPGKKIPVQLPLPLFQC